MPGPCRLILGSAALLLAIAAPPLSAQSDVADMREDIRGLTQRVNDLSLRIEQLEHDNAELRAKVSGGTGARDLVTTVQLNGAVAALNDSVRAAVASSRTEILTQVADQMANLAKQTNAALDAMARATAPAPVHAAPAAAGAAEPPGAGTTSKEGISYAVQRGDSIGGIARKTGAKSADIIAANRLADPSKIIVGQVLFIPGGHPPAAPPTP
jgi:LysM repeat protein